MAANLWDMASTIFLYSRGLNKVHGCLRATALQGDFSVQYFASKRGMRRKKVCSASFDTNLADGVVDIDKLSTNMESQVERLRQEFRSTITTRMSPAMFDNIKLSSGNKRRVNLGQVASIVNKDDKYILNLDSSPNLTQLAMKALNENSIFTPLLEGNRITVSVPRLTMEVREGLVRSAKVVSEEAKVGIRKARQKGMNDVRKQKKVISEDDARMVEGYIESIAENYVKQVDKLLVEKSKELLQR